MQQYVCDWCKRVKRAGERWILGFAAETEGATMRQREIAIAADWAEICHPLAVHFCSEEHKNKYVKRFLDAPQATTGKRCVRPRPAVNTKANFGARGTLTAVLEGAAGGNPRAVTKELTAETEEEASSALQQRRRNPLAWAGNCCFSE